MDTTQRELLNYSLNRYHLNKTATTTENRRPQQRHRTPSRRQNRDEGGRLTDIRSFRHGEESGDATGTVNKQKLKDLEMGEKR